MHRIAIITVGAASLLIAGCNNEPEETPDITEAIPLEEVETLDENGEPVDNDASAETDSNGSSTGANWAGDPNTVQRGDNAGAPPIDLESSKLQRAD